MHLNRIVTYSESLIFRQKINIAGYQLRQLSAKKGQPYYNHFRYNASMNLSPISIVKDIVRTSQLSNGPSVNCETQSGEPPHAAHFTLKIAEPGGKNYEHHFCSRHMTEELANQPAVMAKVMMWTLDKQIPMGPNPRFGLTC